MSLRSLLIGISLWAAATVTASAEIYTWTDAQGTVHFTEDAGSVPPELRKPVRNGEESAAPAETTTPPQPAENKLQAQPVRGEDDAVKADWTREQWQQEMQNLEAAMVEVRNRLDDLADRARKAPPRTPEQGTLVAAHQSLLVQYNDMKARYFQLVEAARKAGFPVDLQQ